MWFGIFKQSAIEFLNLGFWGVPELLRGGKIQIVEKLEIKFCDLNAEALMIHRMFNLIINVNIIHLHCKHKVSKCAFQHWIYW